MRGCSDAEPPPFGGGFPLSAERPRFSRCVHILKAMRQIDPIKINKFSKVWGSFLLDTTRKHVLNNLFLLSKIKMYYKSLLNYLFP